jgi:hypothetical protein
MRYYGDFDSGMRNESIAERERRLGRKLTYEEARERLTHDDGWRKPTEDDRVAGVLALLGYKPGKALN